MKHRRIFMLSIVAMCFTFTACLEKSIAPACDTSKIVEKAIAQLQAVKDYQFTATALIEGYEAVSIIAGQSPDRLRIYQEIKQGSRHMRVLVVFDGKHQWIESGSASMRQVLKLDTKKLTRSDRPFDTSYYLMGTGLLNGEGYIGTIETLLFVYDLKAECNNGQIHLAGPINMERFKRYAVKIRSFNAGYSNIEKFAQEFGYLNITFDAFDFAAISYSMGPVSKEIKFEVKFTDLRVNKGLEDGAFEYTLPPGVEVIDITEDLIKRYKQ